MQLKILKSFLKNQEHHFSLFSDGQLASIMGCALALKKMIQKEKNRE